MSLEAGTRLGVFEILAPLGKGGMGEVYRAKDTKLSREVAIKVLPEALTQDLERLARFRRGSRAPWAPRVQKRPGGKEGGLACGRG